MEKHKFSVLEIQEYYETYCMRKDLAEQVIRLLGDWGGFCQWNFIYGNLIPGLSSDKMVHDNRVLPY